MRLHFIPQQGQGVAHIVKQDGVVLNHQAQTGVCCHGRTEWAQVIALVAAHFQQAQCHRRLQQALHGGGMHAAVLRQLLQLHGLFAQQLKQVQPDAGQQHLRVHKTRHDFKQLGCASARDPACQRIADGPAVKAGRSHPLVQLVVELLPPARSDTPGFRQRLG